MSVQQQDTSTINVREWIITSSGLKPSTGRIVLITLFAAIGYSKFQYNLLPHRQAFRINYWKNRVDMKTNLFIICDHIPIENNRFYRHLFVSNISSIFPLSSFVVKWYIPRVKPSHFLGCKYVAGEKQVASVSFYF